MECLRVIQKACGLPEACYISESLAVAVNCAYPLCRDSHEYCGEIAILDIGYSKASLSLVDYDQVVLARGLNG